MGHLKKQNIPKSWPVLRKGTAFIAKPSSKEGIPLLVALRDLLKTAKTRKEIKKALQKKFFLVNGKPAKDEKAGIGIFDTLSIVPSKENYRLEFSEKGKFELKKIGESEASRKIAKIKNKKMLKGKKMQLNFYGGENLITDVKFSCRTGDSAVISFKNKKIEKCLPLKEGAEIVIFAGKHSGKKGRIEKIISEKMQDSKERKIAVINLKNEKINALTEQVIAVE